MNGEGDLGEMLCVWWERVREGLGLCVGWGGGRREGLGLCVEGLGARGVGRDGKLFGVEDGGVGCVMGRGSTGSHRGGVVEEKEAGSERIKSLLL